MARIATARSSADGIGHGERWLAGMLLVGLVRASTAFSEESPALDPRQSRAVTAAMNPIPARFRSDDLANQTTRPDGVFSRRPSGASDSDGARVDAESGPLLHDTTVWERLNEYRARDRVRVITLWHDRASSVSLQADRHGGPSLQWTSRQMSVGGATHGVLDRWLAASLAGAGQSLRSLAHSGPTGAPSKKPEAAAAALK